MTFTMLHVFFGFLTFWFGALVFAVGFSMRDIGCLVIGGLLLTAASTWIVWAVLEPSFKENSEAESEESKHFIGAAK